MNENLSEQILYHGDREAEECNGAATALSVTHLSWEAGKYCIVIFSKGELRHGQKPWSCTHKGTP